MKEKMKMMTQDGKKQETSGYITNSQYDQLPVGLIAQLVEHCNSMAGVLGWNPFQAWIFPGFNFITCITAMIDHKIGKSFNLSTKIITVKPDQSSK